MILCVTIAIKNAIDSIGKHRAEPIDANFRSGITTPLGRVALELLHANTLRLKDGKLASMQETRPADTRSLASDISNVAEVRDDELSSASLALIF
jgi:hypothetical protein